MRRDLREPDGHADVHHPVLPHEAEIPDGLSEVLGDPLRGLERAVLQEHAELVAAEARERIGSADTGLHHARELFQEAIAGLVPAGVVDHLELVEVEIEQHMAHAIATARGEQRLVEPRFELTTIDQSGERRGLPGRRARAAAGVPG